MRWRAAKKTTRKKRSRSDSRRLNPTDAVTVTTTDLADLRHLVTDAAAHPDGGADLQRGEARRRGESAIAARAPDDIAAGPEKDGTAPNLQVTTEATDTAATPSLRRGVQKRATRRVEEETSDFTFLPLFFFFFTFLNFLFFK